MDLIVQVPMQYWSLQHLTLLLSPVTSTTGYCFCFGSIPSFFLELFLHWSPVAYSVSYHFAFSYCSWGSQGKNTEVVCYSLLQWTTLCQNSTPWPVRIGWPPTFMQSTSWETRGWRKHKLESRLLGETSITSDMQMTPPLWPLDEPLDESKTREWKTWLKTLHSEN